MRGAQARSTAILRMFHAMATNDHSPRTAASPRSKNWRNPITDLMMPNTGSTVCLRSAYRARPARVFRRLLHFRECIARFGQGRRLGEALVPGPMMRFAPECEQRFDVGRTTGADVRLAEVAGIGEQRGGRAEGLGQRTQGLEHGHELLLVVGCLAQIGGELRIPAEAGHRFRCKPITDSSASRSLIPVQADH